ncbi:hypothetical protein V9T40_014258 [Parthenolecanium corni]|uniref:Uncharacterized protein n=1 Tax=Parthenolecanium corni TaxID=536013 RepID=A0AAN9T3J0_9HEMI
MRTIVVRTRVKSQFQNRGWFIINMNNQNEKIELACPSSMKINNYLYQALISVISQDLSTVRSKLNVSIGSDVPINEKDILENLSILKSWIKELNETVVQLQISESHLKNSNFTSPKENSSEKVPTTDAFSIDRGHLNDSSHFMSLVNKLTENITYINNSLNSEIQLMKEEHSRDHEILRNLSSFTYNNVSHRLNHFEDELNGMSQKLNVVSSSSNKTDVFNKTSSTATDNSESSKVVSPKEEEGRP